MKDSYQNGKAESIFDRIRIFIYAEVVNWLKNWPKKGPILLKNYKNYIFKPNITTM